jgi:hypothetical protein
LEHGEFRFTSHEAGAHAFSERVRLEADRYRQYWSNVGDKNIVGVLFHAIYPVAVGETQSMMAAQTVVHSVIANRRSQPFDELIIRLPDDPPIAAERFQPVRGIEMRSGLSPRCSVGDYYRQRIGGPTLVEPDL